MAGIAGAGRRNMHRRFADNSDIGPAMACRTGPAANSNARMVERSSGERYRRQVTGFAGSGGREMVRRFGDHRDPVESLAGGVATGTTSRDPRVIHQGSRPEGGRIVASFAA